MTTLKLYIDWNNRVIKTQKEIDQEIHETMEEIMTTDCADFETYLDDNYSGYELYHMTEGEKAELFDDYTNAQKDNIVEDFEREYDTITINLETKSVTY